MRHIENITIGSTSEVASVNVPLGAMVTLSDGTESWILTDTWDAGDAFTEASKTKVPQWGAIGGSIDDQSDLSAALDSAVSTTETEITITVADWSGGTTVNKEVSGVTADSFNAISADKDNSDLLGEFGVIGDSQAEDEITFKADETPTSNITLTIAIFK